MREKTSMKISAILAAILVLSSVFLAIPMVKATAGDGLIEMMDFYVLSQQFGHDLDP